LGYRVLTSDVLRLLLAATMGLLLGHGQVCGQGARPQPADPKADAPFDLTGYWVSVITQNWRLRMVTPPRGDYMGIPLTPAAKVVADAWDPAKDEAAGKQCKSYGAGLIMTVPERLHITWQDVNTMKMEIDTGMQTRLFHFKDLTPHDSNHTWQGYSLASWVSRRSPGSADYDPKARYLRVDTTHMLSGYLRKNGVPYSENAVLKEYYDMINEPSGETWMIVTTVLEDPVYLDYPLTLSAEFKRQPTASGWDPTPCSAKW
jgi:hypothetical protein